MQGPNQVTENSRMKRAKKKTDAQDSDQTLHALHDIEKKGLKDKIADLNEKYHHVITQLKESDDRLNAIMGLRTTVAGHSPISIKIKTGGRTSETVPVLVVSDWHLEEKVDPKTIDGVNTFTPEIATARVKLLFERALSMINIFRQKSKIDKIIVAVIGDIITNMIHDDHRESNYMSPTEATLKGFRLLCGGIDFLLKEGGFKEIIIPCNYGNHGRTTQKPRISTAAKNSYEWLMYHLIAERYINEPKLKIQIADGYFSFLEIYGMTLRFHHGDHVKYAGGVGGVSIPLNKAIAQWNKMRHADLDICGHWHTLLKSRDYVVNGSLIGYGPYALSIKASFEPPCQALFLLHPKWGKTVEVPIFLS